MAARQTKVAKAAERTLAALQAAVQERGTEATRRAAEAIVDLRQQFQHDGATDWAGRSPDYRDLIERLYRQAGVPSDSDSTMQSNIRYHIGNVLRGVAPAEELNALGMATDGPLARIQSTRKSGPDRRKKAAPTKVAVSVLDPGVLLTLALDAVRTVGAMDLTEDGVDGIEGNLRQILDETVSVLTGLRG